MSNVPVYKSPGGASITLAPGGSIVFGNATFSIDAAGRLILTGLPTSNPNIAGALWTNSGVLTRSAG